MTSREVLLQEFENLSEQDTEILVALARRLRAKPLPMSGGMPEQDAPAVRPNTAPLAGSVRILGDIVAPVGEPWEVET